MAATYRRVTRNLFISFNVVTAIVFLLACLAPYADPVDWWWISLLGLGFPVLLLVLILFLVFWLFFRAKYLLISLIPIIIGWKSISVLFALHVPEKFNYKKPEDAIRVVHWNVARFKEWKRNNNKGSQTRLKMMDLLQEQNADVLCLQEFFHSTDSTYYDNLNYLMKRMGYSYCYFSWDGDGHRQWVGQAIFSRFPIVDTGLVRYPRPGLPESLIHTDLLYRGDTIRFYTTHLQSVQFRKQDYERIEKIKEQPDEDLIQNSKSIFYKLRRGFQLRSGQARIIRELTGNTPHPFVLTGDFNDVPNSFTYFTIRGEDLQDTYLEKGLGIGRTYSALSPTLRIDYILTTPHFTVQQFNRIVKNYSDHYMLVADLKLQMTSVDPLQPSAENHEGTEAQSDTKNIQKRNP